MQEQSYHYFLQEAQELLQAIEQELLSLRESYNINKVYNLMRATHTLKGAAASIDLETIATVAHSLEDVFRAICKPDLSIDSEVEALLFTGYECLQISLNAEFTGRPVNDVDILDKTATVLDQLQEKLGHDFAGDADLPNSEQLGFDLTQSMFEIGVTQRLDQLEEAINSANRQEIASTLRTLADVFFGLGESLNLPGFQAISQAVLAALDTYPSQIMTIARLALANFKEAKTGVLNGDRTQGGQPSQALQQLSGPPSSPPSPPLPLPPASISSTVRVKVEHLEQLNYFIGELLTNQNRQSLQNEQLWAAVRVLISRLAKHQQLLNKLNGDRETGIVKNDPQSLIQSALEDTVQLAEATDAIEMFTRQSLESLEKQHRLLTNTRDVLISARMLPLEHLFERFPRILQQLEIVHKKQVMLEFIGGDASVDKAVVEKLYDPLLHLIRNAFDHGIESPSIRQKWGKSEKGLIEICAYYQNRYLIVEVRDDGQGLDFERICAKAVESQLISPEQVNKLTEAQLIDLLFEPGFSTASSVNNLSGRGIGLDVVRTHLRGIQGSVSVYSQPHRGTMFRLQIPLSLTIDRLLVAQAGSRTYALFANAIEEIIIPTADKIRCWDGGKVLRWRQDASETLIPIYQLATALNYFSVVTQPLVSQSKRSSIAEEHKMMPVILIRCQDRLLGLEVDQLLGDRELVIRPLGSMIVPPPYIYGGSILADGQLALVLDATALMDYISERQTHDTSDRNYLTASIIPSVNYQQSELPIQTRAALAQSSLPSSLEKPNKTILLVDDSITVRQSLTLTLQKAGYQVIQAQDGYEAIEQLNYHSDIQLVFCDIEMPRMNGFEFLKRRQQDPYLADVPVVMLTSRSSDKHRMFAFNLGANAYITKPYLEHMLLTTLTDLLKKKHN